ncbi:MAG: 3-phenylpropionate/cinnamic acid dioxygenase subunit beta [Blastomonas sp.]|jgi:3-phenylpropionate/cinnamic acid dioxygenase small subunit|uniref:aromatic-ring-hydroxylating dioxygenase subunit beta n=1 Tax=Blastomonas TaxID=150203 RepID=UPI0006B9AFC7|nr:MULTISPECIES: 3-phenylpropionate/cinnamic acid dioxygenase subunit beta [Blastomonas]AOG00105.1 ring hydroxylating beta subunit [Blastomonas sp. RAC04]KPF74076.1 aromatic-ring-hydroxylating dioxygenase [Blastomonas sp. AAP25]MCO5791937.1 3-phenylpropionate/cinnamic acid dioxygenase subunit beta [Blastomonas sp.]MDK2756879.1 3-phenylpropionate/cinnamic acid dioxygenase subunit beta [Blastomonas fulva]
MTTTRSTAAPDQTTILRGLVSRARVPLGSAIYNRLLETLYDEAAALDERRFDDWVAMLEHDLVYTAPIRLTRTGPNRDRDVMRTMYHFHEDYGSILMRTGRLQKSAWAEDPPSRCRRFVTNVRVGECETAGEYEVVSYLFLERSRGDNPENERMTAERRDVWREVDGAYKLARREIIVDQSVLGMSNFAVFL